jgi:hypothetical protein
MAGADWDTLNGAFHKIHRYGELWCYIPSERAYPLTRGAKRKEKSVLGERSSVRATISFPSELYKTLEEIARQKKVSLAWVVREAAEQYIADKWPLFGKSLIGGEKR